MSATFVRIGSDVVILDSIRGVGVRPYRDGRFALHLNGRRSPAYIGSETNCETLMAHYQIDVLDLNVNLEPEEQETPEDEVVYDDLVGDFGGL